MSNNDIDEITDFKNKIRKFINDLSSTGWGTSLPSMLYNNFKQELVNVSQSGGSRKTRKLRIKTSKSKRKYKKNIKKVKSKRHSRK
jgi:hypothetical protein